MSAVNAESFATEWIDAWNSHDLDRILSHYADSIVMLSPLAQKRTGNGRVVGLAALREYWRAGLASQPDLRFQLIEVLHGHECLTLLYRNHRGQSVAETVEFGVEGKVVRAFASYGPSQ